MEIGTGWGLNMPMALFLCQAHGTKTFDLHHLLESRIVLGQIAVIREQRDVVKEIFLPLVEEQELERRLDALCRVRSLKEVCELAGIEYFSPADATKTGLPDHSIDIQVSKTVMEHVPPEVFVRMLHEARRILSPNGVMAHIIDTSDHYSHIDPTISVINFLQYSDKQWSKYAGNHFNYHNRLRVPEFRQLIEENGFDTFQWKAPCDERALKELNDGFPLDAKFRGRPVEDICTRSIDWIGRPVR